MGHFDNAEGYEMNESDAKQKIHKMLYRSGQYKPEELDYETNRIYDMMRSNDEYINYHTLCYYVESVSALKHASNALDKYRRKMNELKKK